MLYWFKKKEGEYFPIENEKQAGDIFKRKDFNIKFEYIGRSDGKKYQEVISQVPKMTKREFESMTASGDDLDEQRANLLKEAFKAEIEVAKLNNDKTKPRNFDLIGLDGRPMTQGTMADMVKMMGQ